MPLYELLHIDHHLSRTISAKTKNPHAWDAGPLSGASPWLDATKHCSGPSSSLIYLPTAYGLLASGTPPLPSTPSSPLTSGVPGVIFLRGLACKGKEREALTSSSFCFFVLQKSLRQKTLGVWLPH